MRMGISAGTASKDVSKVPLFGKIFIPFVPNSEGINRYGWIIPQRSSGSQKKARREILALTCFRGAKVVTVFGITVW